jgi:hypothetical protein
MSEPIALISHAWLIDGSIAHVAGQHGQDRRHAKAGSAATH